MLKLVHISDIHFRNLERGGEYRAVFENFYRKLEEIEPDIIINTGDTVHSKVNITPELVDITSEHLRRASEFAPYHIVLGNHDALLGQKNRQDSLSPIINNLRLPEIHLHKKSGKVEIDEETNLWIFSILDSKKDWPKSESWGSEKEKVNIGLFHGSLRECYTDSGFQMNQSENNLDLFSGLDYVMMGDIHKRQSFRQNRIWYAGSLIQQNFGEDPEKGFLLWEIQDKHNFRVLPINLNGSRKFYSFSLDSKNRPMPPTLNVLPDSRLRVLNNNPLTLAEQKKINKHLFDNYSPYSVVFANKKIFQPQQKKFTDEENSLNSQNLRDLAVQERLLTKFCQQKNVSLNVTRKVLEINRGFQSEIEKQEEIQCGSHWRIRSLAWSNVLNYGEDNVVNFDNLGGIVGIFANNGQGKSNFLNVISETLFDKTDKNITRNIDYINDQKDRASMLAELEIDGKNYVIERIITRQPPKRKGGKEESHTSCRFYQIDQTQNGERQELDKTEEQRYETERLIRRHIGNYQDYSLTSLMAQSNLLDLVNVKETDRRAILYKFLDLDIFEKKRQLCLEEMREPVKRLKNIKVSELEEEQKILQNNQTNQRNIHSSLANIILNNALDIKASEEEINNLFETKSSLPSVKPEPDPSLLSLASIKTRLQEIDTEYSQLEVENEYLRRKLSEISENNKNIDLEFIQGQMSRLEKLKSQETDLEKQLGNIQFQINFHQREISAEIPDCQSFSGCHFLLRRSQNREILEEQVSQEKETRKDLNYIRNEIKSCQGFKNTWDSYCQTQKEKLDFQNQEEKLKIKKENTILTQEKFIQELKRKEAWFINSAAQKENIQKQLQLTQEIEEKQRIKTQTQFSLAKNNQKMNDISLEMGKIQSQQEILAQKISEFYSLADICSAYQIYQEASGKKGIPYEILSAKLPVINAEINNILSLATEFSVNIEDNPEDQTISLYLQYPQGNSRLLELGGGAEKMLSSLAIRVALLNVSSLPRSNLFMVDEGWGKFDVHHFDGIYNLISYLRTKFEHIIIVSHMDSMKDLVDKTIDINKDKDGFSHIEAGVEE